MLFGCYLFCCLGGGVLFFAVWAGARAPPKQQEKSTRPLKQQKIKHAPAPSERVCVFCCLGGCACLCFCCLGGGRVFFCCLGGWRFFFAVWAVACFFLLFERGVRFFLLFGPGACFLFAVWAGEGSSLTYRSAWLVFKRPKNKKDQTGKKKKHAFQLL